MKQLEEKVSIGEYIKRLRFFEKLHQWELGEKIGVTQVTIHNWESGKSEPATKHLAKMNQVLGWEFDLDKIITNK